MLSIVLILVLGALGLLVTALITANSLWAWVSIGLSVLAGLLLVVDYVRRRAARRPARDVDAEPAEEPAEEPESTEEPAKGDTKLLPEAEDDSGEPGVEETAPADVEVVSKLGTEVVVVDEHPRYHLPDCPWIGNRDTIPIAVNEARDLGFTPCARCTPDAKLVATAQSRG
ncbi:hypothetical protein [Amycolatopsis alkalitolerans]|uniref:Uncharacterized protein n=1 Tax=Amycolatopsis alkalitolerans TaxID=2547244 RepID=A0A5C4LZG7_9PSEU|nr:hypothetical protein [Amycolatopsis alkalitolerans]TNC22656.1 hypothetical protein FG385_24760 [Amycolatopsis alkalitolerans]